MECETLDLATADKVFFRNYFYQPDLDRSLTINIFLIKETLERSVKANYGSADHEVAIIIQNAGTIGQNGRKITVSTKPGLIRIQITVPQRSFAISGAYRH